ncbi:MAG: NAD(P)H-dependent oxidoreductase subunit E [Clostridiales bacterium]|jgi:NADH:ubiquinone oxidoreductase subunit E|nr:NAD(P)H-dependent oxidoreductase subunit E [Clostridiales bacterium]
MSNFPFVDAPEKAAKLAAVLESLTQTRGAVMIALQKAQEIYGYLPMEVQQRIADGLGVPLQEVYGVATFYSLFKLVPAGKYKVSVCLGTACYVKGGGDIFEKFKSILKIGDHETTADGLFTLESTRCIGCCGLAPVCTVNDEVFGRLTVDDIEGIVNKFKALEASAANA